MGRLPASILWLTAVGLLCAPSSPAEVGEEYFERRVRPLLLQHCTKCHGPGLQSAGIDLTKPATVLGSAVISGDESSPLVRAIRYESTKKMPPDSKLAPEQIEVLVAWVRMGAPWPGYEPAGDESLRPADESVESSHWSFQPIADPQVPDPGPSEWVRNDIDRFILSRLQEEGLQPAPEAGPSTLLRRAKFDLVGLPPDGREVRRFAGSVDRGAFDRLVKDLLSSDHYGERWGRHWLDVARYADSTGVDEDHPFGDSWRYRDYVVAAFNDDRPFDEFAREQIAGDLLPAPEGSQLNRRGIVATGFLAVGPMALAQRDPIQKKYDVVDEQIDTLSKAFLGLTVACARCHDHKFDPILTSDYYAMAGIFASTRTFDDWTRNGSRYYKHPLIAPDEYARYKAQADALARLERARRVAAQLAVLRHLAGGPATRVAAYMRAGSGRHQSAELDQETLDWFRIYLRQGSSPRAHLAAWLEAGEDEEAVALEYQIEILDGLRERIDTLGEWLADAQRALDAPGKAELPAFPAELPDSAVLRDLLDDGGPFDVGFDEIRLALPESDRTTVEALDARIARSEAALPAPPPTANAVTDGETVAQRIFVRGQHQSPGAKVDKRFPLVLAGTDQRPIESGSGRLELASWIASPDNPLTARVIVNRVWQWHFGEGLVRTPSNFGLRGEPPTHPQLLDWLASRFIEGGWSIKALHRLIMASATYRMTSATSTEAWEADPDNRLWSRFRRRRLTIEELRDSYLALSGELDPTVGGDTDTGSGDLAEFDRNNRRINPDNHQRRSIYLPLMRNKLPSLLGLFDFGDATTSGGDRSETNVAPQALYLMNSGFVLRTASAIAGRLAGGVADKVQQAYRIVLARPPSDEEVARAIEFITANSDPSRGWAGLCKTLLASNEFHFVE